MVSFLVWYFLLMLEMKMMHVSSFSQQSLTDNNNKIVDLIRKYSLEYSLTNVYTNSVYLLVHNLVISKDINAFSSDENK